MMVKVGSLGAYLILGATAWIGRSNDEEAARVGRAPRLPGEFERQSALLIAGERLSDGFADVLTQIARETAGQVSLVVLIQEPADRARILSRLKSRRVSASHLRFLIAPHDTVWTRDYGPLLVERGPGRWSVVDARYNFGDRPKDEVVPEHIARHLGLPLISTPLILEGGNLLSNGKGLLLTTRHTAETNREAGLDGKAILAQFRTTFGARHVVFLEALKGEETSHVDMFALFTAPDTVVVGAYDPKADAENAAVLDRNATMLAGLSRSRGGPLKVIRIPMPNNADGVWRTYTNVAFANRVVFVPVYPGVDAPLERTALEVLRGALPGRRIVTVNAKEMAAFGGALHCITRNLGGAAVR